MPVSLFCVNKVLCLIHLFQSFLPKLTTATIFVSPVNTFITLAAELHATAYLRALALFERKRITFKLEHTVLTTPPHKLSWKVVPHVIKADAFSLVFLTRISDWPVELNNLLLYSLWPTVPLPNLQTKNRNSQLAYLCRLSVCSAADLHSN